VGGTRTQSGSLVGALQAYCPALALTLPLHAVHTSLNKYILARELGGFPFPLALTSAHMAFCSLLSTAAVRLKLVEVQEMPAETYVRCAVRGGSEWRCQSHAWQLAACSHAAATLPCPPCRNRCVVPIGVLFGVTLWAGNAAYLSLSVSFIQMIKV
jgi:hypothetical protein